MSKRSRGNTVVLDESWWQLVCQKVAELPKADRGVIQLGKALARVAGRPKAWGRTQVSNFLHDDPAKRVTTIEMANAFSKLLKIDPPLLAAFGPEEMRWIRVGLDIKRLDDKHFLDELLMLERWAKLRKEKTDMGPGGT